MDSPVAPRLEAICKSNTVNRVVFSKEPLEATLTLPHKNPNQTTKGSIVRKITEQEKTRPYSVDNRHPVFPSLEDRIDKAAQHPKTMFGAALSSPLGSLSSKQALELAKVYLENARSANDSDIAMVLYHDTKVSLSQAKKVIKRAEDPALIEGIASAYIDLAEQLETRGRESEAQYSYKKAAKLGGTTSRRSNTSIPRDTKEPLSSTVGPVEKLQVPGKERNDPSKQEIQEQQIQVIVMAASHIFTENVRPPAVDQKLPEPDERLVSTPQLVRCLGLLQISQLTDNILEPMDQKWLQDIENDMGEKERLHKLATEVIRTFKRDESLSHLRPSYIHSKLC
ncbi:hypothetical protein BGX31_007387 [Mortierella sp. GBA43]|nr:hypothetical protein BGX31_007387 [Mortierella sp. GBA43]